MASEYLKKLAKQQENIQPVYQPKTKKEKWKNWWDYSKNYVLIALAALIVLGFMIRSTIINRAPDPDHQVAILGAYRLPEGTTDALAQALTVYGEDLNQDGQVLVKVVEYPIFNDDPIYQMGMSAQVQLSVDFQDCMSIVFLMEDPERVQTSLEILAFPDGRIPEEEEITSSDIWYGWEDCPVLAELELGEYREALSGLYVARRAMNTQEYAENAEGLAFWETLIQGAK